MRRQAKGFTLVELLVVIAIIGALVALLLPAVQAAREASRRSACQNNLKELAVALLAAHDAMGEFPRGAYTHPNKNNPASEDGLGWATKILPQLEQGNIYDRLVTSNIAGFGRNPWQSGIFAAAYGGNIRPIPGGDSVLSVFRCPSSELPELVPPPGEFGVSLDVPFENTGYAVSMYKGSRGYCDRGMFWRTAEGLRVATCPADYDGDGTLGVIEKAAFTKIRLKDVIDGTSHTIALGEASYFVSVEDYPMWMGTAMEDGSALFKTQDVINCNIGGASLPLSAFDRLRLPGGSASDDCAFSRHVGGAYFAFVDSSVHFLSEELSLQTFRMLGDRMDEEITRDFE